jgi:hypothetical protein
MPKGVNGSVYATPVTSIHHLAKSPVLPSHISIFGHEQPEDVSMGGGGGGVKLPSHISAFGDGEDVDSAYLIKQLNGQTFSATENGVHQGISPTVHGAGELQNQWTMSSGSCLSTT